MISYGWCPLIDVHDELDDDMSAMSAAVFDMWLFFDRARTNHRLVVDKFLDKTRSLSPGERLYLHTAPTTTMRLYQIVDISRVFPSRSKMSWTGAR